MRAGLLRRWNADPSTHLNPQFWAGMELYPRLGEAFDLKTWTNCRMGMMGWAVLILCYAVKQRQLYGAVADSMAVSVLLMQFYILKFFL